MEEFYIQGDKERELGMRVSDGFDRTNPTPAAKFQNGFIAFIVKPLYSALDKLSFLDMKVPLEHIDDNLMHWKRVGERKVSSFQADKAPVDPAQVKAAIGRGLQRGKTEEEEDTDDDDEEEEDK
jgi:hypothetical protein